MNKKNLKKRTTFTLIYSALIIWTTIIFSYSANGFESYARTVLVVDDLTNTVLLEKNAMERTPPASLSKLMTLYMIFDALRANRVLMSDMIRVSKKASAKGGSKMFLNEGQEVSIQNIIRGIIIHSGNDACIAIAEALAGTEDEFAKQMNFKAKTLGLTNSSFMNSTGWPEQNHYMSPRDMVNLAKRIRTEFPEYYKFFAEDSFTWNGITQKNRNPLLYKGLGADGLKTGHTEEAGYGLVGSATRGNRRITFAITGLDSSKERMIEAEKITNWAYRDFTAKRVANKGTIIGYLPVWLGEKEEVGVYAKEDLYILTPITADPTFITAMIYNTPIEAPFESGAITPAKLKVTFKSETETIEKEFELFAYEGSKLGNFIIRFKAATTIVINYIMKIIK